MADVYTYKNLIAIFDDIAQRHYEINYLGVGANWEIGADDVVYPILWVNPISANMIRSEGNNRYTSIEMVMNVKCLDLLSKDEANEDDVNSDTFQILTDVVNEFNDHPFYQRSNMLLIDDINFTNLDEYSDDNSNGWECELTIKMRNINSFCGLPVSNIQGFQFNGPEFSAVTYSTQYLTCDTVTGCTSLQTYITNEVQAQASTTWSGGTVVLDSTFLGDVQVNGNFSASTLYSGSTNLETIITNLADNNEDTTRVQPGLNTYTGGTGNLPTVNISGLTIDNITVSGASSFDGLSATTIYSGSTELSDIFAPIGSDTNTFTTGATITNDTIFFDRNDSLSAFSVDISSVNTDDITRVQPGSNTTTGGTANLPVINVSPSPSFNDITFSGTATGGDIIGDSISATTIYSGSTNLNTVITNIAQQQGDKTRVQGGTNISTGGTANEPIVNLDANIEITSATGSTFQANDGLIIKADGTVSPGAGEISVFSTTVNGVELAFIGDSNANEFSILRDSVIVAKNQTGSVITKGQAVTITGSTGTVPNLGLGIADGDISSEVIGLAYDDIADNDSGNIMIAGIISIDTSAWTSGDDIYLSPTVLGGLTNVKPSYSDFSEKIGVVLVSGVGNGSLYVTTEQPVFQRVDSNDVFHIDENLIVEQSLSAQTIYSGSTDLYDIFSTNSTVAEGISTGIISGGSLSINAGDNTKFDIEAGLGYVIDTTVYPQSTTLVEWPEKTGVTVTNLATSFATDVAIDISGNTVQQDSFTNAELRSLIFLGGLDHSNLTNIRNVFQINVPSYGVGSSLKELTKAIGDLNLDGNVFSANGANLKLDKSAGSAFSYGRNFQAQPNNPHVISQSATTQQVFRYVFNNGSGVGSFGAEVTDVDPDNYDDGSGTLASVGVNNWTIQRLLLFPNSQTVFVQYGETVYNTQSEALEGLGTQAFTELAGISSAMVRGYLVVQQGATDLTEDAQFITASKFGGAGGSAGSSTNFYTTGGTVSGTSIVFDRNDLVSAYSVDISEITGDMSVSGSFSAATFYSGSTDLSTVISNAASGDITRLQGGLNTYTGGTANLPTVNISGGTFDNINVTGTTNLSSVIICEKSASTQSITDCQQNTIEIGTVESAIIGGSYNLVSSGSTGVVILGSEYVTGSTDYTTYTNNIDAQGNILSGGTNIYDIFGKVPYDFQAAASDEITPITIGTAKITFYAPRDFTMTAITATLTTTGSTTTTVDVNVNGSSALASPIDLVSGDYYEQATASTSGITAFDRFTVDVDAAGTDATGLKIILNGYSRL